MLDIVLIITLTMSGKIVKDNQGILDRLLTLELKKNKKIIIKVKQQNDRPVFLTVHSKDRLLTSELRK